MSCIIKKRPGVDILNSGGIGVSNSAITDAVNNPVKPPIIQSGGRTKYIGRDATVVLNQEGKVVTTWANRGAGTR